LTTVLKIFEDEKLEYPVLIHCRSGKDRTGVVIAAILTILGVEAETIIEEFLLSKGTMREMMETHTLPPFTAQKGGDLNAYYRKKVNLKKVKQNILGPGDTGLSNKL